MVNGASGGVGTLVVQVARAFGAERVTAVCGSRHADAVRKLGADEVVDYAGGGFEALEQVYDVAIQVNGNRSWSSYRRVLREDGALVIVGGPPKSRLVGPLAGVGRLLVASRIGPRTAVFFISTTTRDDIDVLRPLLEDGQVAPVIDRTYDLGDAAAAFDHLGRGHLTGKVVVTI